MHEQRAGWGSGRLPLNTVLLQLQYPPGNYPRYHADLTNAADTVDTSRAGAFELQRLAFAFPGSNKSQVRIEMNAGLIRWIQSTAPGQIISIAYVRLPSLPSKFCFVTGAHC